MPSAQAESTRIPAIGKMIRMLAMVSSRRSPSKPGVKTETSTGASRMPIRASAPATATSSAKIVPATRPASSSLPSSSSSE